ncbi:hypothetical protein EJI00_07595 [Variovorax sp. DXTD-1]|nr:hypothetical protein EJI00_07595 [Variovorax sp. DXTD-1]
MSWPCFRSSAFARTSHSSRLRTLRAASPPPRQGATPAARQSRFRGVARKGSLAVPSLAVRTESFAARRA